VQVVPLAQDGEGSERMGEQVTWWWLWDVFILLVLMAGAIDHLANKKAGLAALSVFCCWIAFFRLLSSYGAW
jgi:hypothetical protein